MNLDADEKLKQVVEFAGCDVELALKALHQNEGNVENAIGAIMEGSISIQQDSSSFQSTVPSIPSSSTNIDLPRATWSNTNNNNSNIHNNNNNNSSTSTSHSLAPYHHDSFQIASSNGRANAREGNDMERDNSMETGQKNDPISIPSGPDEIEDPELAKALEASLQGLNNPNLPPLYGPHQPNQSNNVTVSHGKSKRRTRKFASRKGNDEMESQSKREEINSQNPSLDIDLEKVKYQNKEEIDSSNFQPSLNLDLDLGIEWSGRTSLNENQNQEDHNDSGYQYLEENENQVEEYQHSFQSSSSRRKTPENLSSRKLSGFKNPNQENSNLQAGTEVLSKENQSQSKIIKGGNSLNEALGIINDRNLFDKQDYDNLDQFGNWKSEEELFNEEHEIDDDDDYDDDYNHDSDDPDPFEDKGWDVYHTASSTPVGRTFDKNNSNNQFSNQYESENLDPYHHQHHHLHHAAHETNRSQQFLSNKEIEEREFSREISNQNRSKHFEKSKNTKTNTNTGYNSEKLDKFKYDSYSGTRKLDRNRLERNPNRNQNQNRSRCDDKQQQQKQQRPTHENWGENGSGFSQFQQRSKPIHFDLDNRSDKNSSFQKNCFGSKFLGGLGDSSRSFLPPVNEDEELNRAIAASMAAGQSHNPVDVDSQNGFGNFDNRNGNVYQDSITPYINRDLKVGPDSKRDPNTPMVLIPRYPALQMISLFLQALFNANPAKNAFLQFSPPDSRITEAQRPESSLKDYWRGSSPNGIFNMNARSFEEIKPLYIDSVDTTTRIQSLFAFMQHSNRSHSICGDVFEKIPNSVMIMNSENKSPGEISSSYLDYLGHCFKNSLEMSSGPNIEGSRSSRGGKNNWNIQMLSSINNYGHIALTAPSSPISKRKEIPIPKYSQEGVWKVELKPSLIFKNVSSCLHNAFQTESNGPCLLTIPAETLCLQVKDGLSKRGYQGMKDGDFGSERDSDWRPIEIQSRIYLDRYLWETHDGLQMEWGFRRFSEQIKILEKRKNDLESYRLEMLVHEGQDSLELLRSSIKFFENVEPRNDTIRAEREKESGAALREILQKVESDVAKIKEEQKLLDDQLLTLKLTMQSEIESSMNDPRFQQKYPYDLSSILMWDENSSWGYFRQEGVWWKIEDGKISESSESIALNDQRGSPEGRGVYYLFYVNSNPTGHLANLPQLNSMFRLAVDSDNQLLETEIRDSFRPEGVDQGQNENENQAQVESSHSNSPPSLPPRPVLGETNLN